MKYYSAVKNKVSRNITCNKLNLVDQRTVNIYFNTEEKNAREIENVVIMYQNLEQILREVIINS